jgi:hypothetical protein
MLLAVLGIQYFLDAFVLLLNNARSIPKKYLLPLYPSALLFACHTERIFWQ